MSRPVDPRLLEFLTPFPSGVTDLALGLREIVREEAPQATELIYDAYSAVSIGYTYSGRLKEAFCHIAVYSSHVNLGFNRGSQLADPHRLLVGTGRMVRHISIKSAADLRKPYLRTFLQQAQEGLEKSAARKPIVKQTRGEKRRPSAAKLPHSR